MKAISLWQPWASLIAAGLKPFETRHWAPPRALIGQRIAIHAAKRVEKEMLDDLRGLVPSPLPVGCLLCTAILDAAFQVGEEAEGTARPAAVVVRRMTSRVMPECFTVRYDEYGDYSPGRWAWLLRDIRPLTPPVIVKGRQGFFEVDLTEAPKA